MMRACKLKWLRGGWWIVALVVLAFAAAELVVCSGTHAGNGIEPAGTYEIPMAVCELKDGPALPGWDWEWNWDLDPITVEGPVLLR